MPRHSKAKKHLLYMIERAREARQERKRRRIEFGNTSPPPCHPPQPAVSLATSPQSSAVSQPSTSHSLPTIAQQSKSKLTIRERCLKKIESEDESKDMDSDSEMIIISKRRLKTLVSSRCPCQVPELSYKFEADAFDSTITMECSECNFARTSEPVREEAGKRKSACFSKANIAMTYHSIVNHTGYTGMKETMRALGMPISGKHKYYRYMTHLLTKMKEFYHIKQTQIHEAIRNYYKTETCNKPDGDGIIKIDVLYDSTWMKRGHTSNIGMGVVIEVYTGFIVDFELLCKFCFHCSIYNNRLKTKKITKEQHDAWKVRHKEECTINYEGPSGGMEQAAALRLFPRSVEHGFAYEHIVSDGDTNTAEMLARVCKAKFAGFHRLQFVAQTAVIHHNFGYERGSLLNYLNIKSSSLKKTLITRDKEKRISSVKSIELIPKKEKKSTDYEPGGSLLVFTSSYKNSGEEPYECTICKTSFSQSCTLKNHIRTHAVDNSDEGTQRGVSGEVAESLGSINWCSNEMLSHVKTEMKIEMHNFDDEYSEV